MSELDPISYSKTKKNTEDLASITNPAGATDGQVLTVQADGSVAYENVAGGSVETPVATYTHTANKSAVISAVDVDTNTFTSVGHPFVVDDKVYFVINVNANNVFLPNIIPTGFTVASVYYIIADGLTVDTFKLSATQGGVAVDITTNASLDLANIHLEAYSVDLITISNLLPRKKYKLHFRGRSLRAGSQYLYTNIALLSAMWSNNGNFNYPIFSYDNVWEDFWAVIDCTGILTITIEGHGVKTNNTTSNTYTDIKRIFTHNLYSNQDITSILLNTGSNVSLANGTFVEVYNA